MAIINKITKDDTEYELGAQSFDYTTTAPTAANTDGIKFVVLDSEPSTKYDGWLYIIKEFTGLCFTANTAGSTITLNKVGSPGWYGVYSLNGTEWVDYTPGTTGAITLTNKGDKVYFKGSPGMAQSSSNYVYFSMTGSIAASGNVMSFIKQYSYETATSIDFEWSFLGLFMGCTSLTSAPSLPATGLRNYCYYGMFAGCTNLTTVPALPATKLYEYCYNQMFSGCTSLYVADSSGSGYTCAWRIPSSGTFTSYGESQSSVFTDCLGTRSSDDLDGSYGTSCTYYTQNDPV